MIPFLKVKFVNGDSSDVKVTKINFKRGGISSDSDISQAYLYDDGTLLAEYNSFSNGVLTFSNSSGLFTVPAGGSKTVVLKADLANGTASGKTIRFSIESSSDIESDASSVNGSYPLVGNYMSTAQASDVGRLDIDIATAPPSSVDPQENLEVFNFNLQALDQKIELRKLTLTNIGSTDADDLVNFKLYDGGTQVGDTVASMNSDKTVTFDLTSNPLVIDKGVAKAMHVRADVVGGTDRTFRFSIQNMTDIVAYDTQYGIYIKPDGDDSWTVIQAGNASSINTGRLTISRASDSPSGNVPKDGTNVTIAKFDLKATGEDVKITQMVVRVYGTVGLNDLDQGKIYFDGAQKGSTTDLNTASTSDATAGDTTFSFGNTFIVPADGSTHTLEIKADIKKGNSESYLGSETLTAKIQSMSAQGKTSLASVTPGTASGHQLTIASGTLSATKNNAVASWATSTPTGVPGATEVLVGSFIVTAGASEGADITAIKITDSSSAFDNLQNLKVYNGTKDSGTQIGTTQSSLTTSQTYTFYPSPYISLAASGQFTLNVYADIKTGAATGSQGAIVLSEVDGTGKTTNTSVNYTEAQTGQTIYIASAGSLTVSQDGGAPKSAQVIAGTTGVEFNKVKFVAGPGEDINVTQIVVTATLDNSAPTSSISNISLWDGTTQIGSTVASLATNGTATFDLSSNPWQIPASDSKVLTIKADINHYSQIQSGGSVVLGLAQGAVTAKGAVSGTSTGTSSAVSGYAMYTYKTVLTFAKSDSDMQPTAGASPRADQHLLYFDVTNGGEYEAALNNATFTLSYTKGTGNATTSQDRVFYLYDSSDSTNPVASTTVSAGTDLTDGETIAFSISGGYSIPANSTKTFYVTGDLRDAGTTSGSDTGSRVDLSISSGTNVDWDDLVASSVVSSVTKVFPIYGPTLSW